jgi:hypothetical protein
MEQGLMGSGSRIEDVEIGFDYVNTQHKTQTHSSVVEGHLTLVEIELTSHRPKKEYLSQF